MDIFEEQKFYPSEEISIKKHYSANFDSVFLSFFPFFLVNLAPAFTSIPLRTYFLATLVGIVPGTFVFVNLGETLGRIESLQGLVSIETLGAFALLGLLALVPIIIRRLKT